MKTTALYSTTVALLFVLVGSSLFAQEESVEITKQEIIDAMGELRTHLREGDLDQVRPLMSETAYKDWAAQSVASGAMLASIDIEGWGEAQEAMAGQIADIKLARKAFEEHGIDWAKLGSADMTRVGREKLREQVKEMIPEDTAKCDAIVKSIREVNHYGGDTSRGYSPHLFWSRIGSIKASEDKADVSLTLVLSMGVPGFPEREIGEVTTRFEKVDGNLVYQGIIAGEEGWVVGGPFFKTKEDDAKKAITAKTRKMSDDKVENKEATEKSQESDASDEKQKDKSKPSAKSDEPENGSDVDGGQIKVDFKAVDFNSEFFENSIAIPDTFGAENLGLRYPSPGFCDLDRDGQQELLIGSISGEFIVCKNVSKTKPKAWGTPKPFLDKDGQPIKIFNY